MRAMTYVPGAGDVDVPLELVEQPVPEPGPGEVRVKVAVAGVNPTDWKVVRGASVDEVDAARRVPGQDAAGVVDAVGAGVESPAVGERVWVWLAAYRQAAGAAQEYLVVPASQAVPLPEGASFDLGASLGVPAVTAHRALTVGGGGRLGPGSLQGQVVLVAGGAGAVGHAAIELARYAGALVVATVSGEEKAELARAAGADLVVNYRQAGAAERIRRVAPGGVDRVVEVAPAANAELTAQVLAPGGQVAVYAADGDGLARYRVRDLMVLNASWHAVLLYTMPKAAKERAVEDVARAVVAGALRVGAAAGMPLHRFPLQEAGRAHEAVRSGAVGKVLIDVA